MPAYNIAYVFTPIEFGGAERVNLSFLKHVNRSKFNILPVLLVRPWEKDNQVVRELKEENYTVFEVPVAKRPRSEGRDYFRILRSYRLLHAIVRTHGVHLIHTHGYFADIIGMPAAKRGDIPHLSTCHGFIENSANLKMYNQLDRLVLRFADRIIAVSPGVRTELVKKGLSPSRIVTIPNAVNGNASRERFVQQRREKRKLLKLGNRDFVAGYAGRLSEEKGLLYLLQACSCLQQSALPLKVVLMGEGPQRKELEQFVRKQRLEECVIIAGFVKNIEDWLPALDVFVLPSLTEGTPMALLEAMAAGIPTVASAVGGVPSVIDSGRNGILVPPCSPEEIGKALQLLYSDEALGNKLAAAARQTVLAKYNMQDWLWKLEQEYVMVLNRKHTSHGCSATEPE